MTADTSVALQSWLRPTLINTRWGPGFQLALALINYRAAPHLTDCFDRVRNLSGSSPAFSGPQIL